MSDLLNVYAALASQNVRSQGKIVRCFGLRELKNTFATADLPARLLLPIGTPTDGKNFGFIALGSTYSITWQIVDLFLYKPVTQGLGLPEVAEMLIEYCGNYADMLRTFRAPTERTYIEDAQLSPSIFEWPRESGMFYTGVEALLQVTEIKGG